MKELSLFSGAGGGLLGTKLLGWEHIGYVEFNSYCQQVIAQRIKDGLLNEAPIFSDIRAFNSEGFAGSYKGLVDVITAGFPCQPFSVAGKNLGEDDERNMWPETIKCIRTIRPTFAYLENVSGLLASGYFGRILGDLAESGYDCRWRILSAAEVGAPHKRDRLWIVAHSKRVGIQRDSEKQIQGKRALESGKLNRWFTWWDERPDKSKYFYRGVGDGVANYMDRLKAAGNGQVPAVVKTAWELLTKG